MSEVLIKCYRGDLLETVHSGNIAIVDENLHLVASAGDPHGMTYYRSCSKPIQALPLILHHLDEKHQLTDREIAVCCSSHLAQEYHVETILGILEKAGFKEEDLIMKPDYPGYKALAEKYLIEGKPKRKVYHNCSGKHTSLLMVSRELDADYHDYYKLDSSTQQEILRCISKVAQWPVEEIMTGIDGCGVPVFAVPLNHMAFSFLKLRCPDAKGDKNLYLGLRGTKADAEDVSDEEIARGLARIAAAMNAHPEMIRGDNSLCLAVNSDPNLVGKLGAEGVYTIGMKKERLGIAIKMTDGLVDPLPMVVGAVLKKLGYQNDALYEKLDKLYEKNIYNHNQTVIGERKADFPLRWLVRKGPKLPPSRRSLPF